MGLIVFLHKVYQLENDECWYYNEYEEWQRKVPLFNFIFTTILRDFKALE